MPEEIVSSSRTNVLEIVLDRRGCVVGARRYYVACWDTQPVDGGRSVRPAGGWPGRKPV